MIIVLFAHYNNNYCMSTSQPLTCALIGSLVPRPVPGAGSGNETIVQCALLTGDVHSGHIHVSFVFYQLFFNFLFNNGVDNK